MLYVSFKIQTMIGIFLLWPFLHCIVKVKQAFLPLFQHLCLFVSVQSLSRVVLLKAKSWWIDLEEYVIQSSIVYSEAFISIWQTRPPFTWISTRRSKYTDDQPGNLLVLCYRTDGHRWLIREMFSQRLFFSDLFYLLATSTPVELRTVFVCSD